jgi:uncharacterized protein (TIGR00251 family)
MAASWYCWNGTDLILNLRIQPRAARDEIVGPLGNTLKIRLTAPPVDGKANEHLREFLGKQCGVAKSQVTVLSGDTSREKRVRIASPRRLPSGIVSGSAADI